MEQLVRVTKVYDNGRALVRLDRESACSGDCHKCGGCGAVQQTLLVEAENPIGAKPGELVRIGSDSGRLLWQAALLYLMPLCLFFLGYLAGAVWWGREILSGCGAFVLGIAGVTAYDRLVLEKKKTVYTILGYPTASALEAFTEGNGKDD